MLSKREKILQNIWFFGDLKQEVSTFMKSAIITLFLILFADNFKEFFLQLLQGAVLLVLEDKK